MADSTIYLELLDRDSHVIGLYPVDAAAFPITIRLADGQTAPVTQLSSIAAEGGLIQRPILAAFWSRLMSPMGAVTTIITTTIFLTLVTYAHIFSKSGRMTLLGIMFGYLTLFATWSAGWAIGGRIARRQARFRDQFTWTCACALTVLGFGYVVRWEEFLFPDSDLFAIMFALIGVIIAIAALYGHLSIASKMSARRRWRGAVATVGVCVALMGLIVYAGWDDFNTSLTYNSSMQPLDARLIPTESVHDFTEDIASLQHKVDREANKR